MSTTPEGKVKNAVNKLLDKYTQLYRYWPVPNIYGASSLDCIVCFRGLFIAIETKAKGKKPTPRQETMIEVMRGAGGIVLVIDGPEGVSQLEEILEYVASTRKPEAQASWRPGYPGSVRAIS